MKGKLFGVSAVLLLAACSKSGQNEKICLTPEAASQGGWDSCVHRWAYRLAPASGPNSEIAEAVLAGCTDAVEWSVMDLVNKTAALKDRRQELLAQTMEAAKRKALFHVVQARAGHCEIP